MLEVWYSELSGFNRETKPFCDSGSILRIHFEEQLDLSLLNVSSHWLHAVHDVVDEMGSISLCHHLSKECSRLLKVIVRVRVLESSDGARNSLSVPLEARLLNRTAMRIRLIVWSTSLVAIDSHEAISLVVVNSSSVRAVDGDLVKVSSKSMPVGVRVREESSLKHLVVRGFNTRHEVSRGKGSLLNFSKVVFRVPVKNELTNSVQWVIRMRPHLCNVKHVKSVSFSIFFWHDLYLPGP